MTEQLKAHVSAWPGPVPAFKPVVDSAARRGMSHAQPADPEFRGNFHCGRLLMKPGLGRAYWDDRDVNLTVTEFKIVHLLASNIGSYVTYRAVYDCMHYPGFIAGSGEHGYRTNVRACIKRIRDKFRAIDTGFSEIDNYQSFGYRWGKP